MPTRHLTAKTVYNSKWPLLAINMQLSSCAIKSALGIGSTDGDQEMKRYVEADQLTNEVFTGFDDALRIGVTWSEVDLEVLNSLVRTHDEFEAAKIAAREAAKFAPKVKGKKFDKSPW